MSQHTHARTRLKRLVALQVHFVGLLVLFRCCLLWEDDGARAVGGLLCLQEHTAPAVVEAQQAAPHYTPACCAVCIVWMKICVFSWHMRFQPACAITDTVLHQGRAWGALIALMCYVCYTRGLSVVLPQHAVACRRVLWCPCPQACCNLCWGCGRAAASSHCCTHKTPGVYRVESLEQP